MISEEGHVTKGELAEYYADVAALILPQIINRPLSLLRCPSGGAVFFQRNPGRGLGADIKTKPRLKRITHTAAPKTKMTFR